MELKFDVHLPMGLKKSAEKISKKCVTPEGL